jgi:CheY-like chemotaxis protein
MKKIRLVIVENDEDEQVFMNEAFQESPHFEVVCFLNNGKELISWLESLDGALPDLILSDLNMPGKNGIDIVRYVKQSAAYSKIPVIITSTSSTRSIAENCLKEGAKHYLVKPESLLGYKEYIERLFRIITQEGHSFIMN